MSALKQKICEKIVHLRSISKELETELENLESKLLETSNSNGIFSKDQNSNNIKLFIDNQKLPLPNIKNLRKWINNDKKAS